MYHDSKTNTILNKEIKSIESITTPMSFVWAFDRLPEWPYTAAGTMAQKSRLLIEQRRRRMLDLVGQDGQATVAELARLFSISAVTARGDLDALASIGSIAPSGAWTQPRITRCVPKKLCTGMRNAESGVLPLSW
jgi:predicted HTH transcriptional regulator